MSNVVSLAISFSRAIAALTDQVAAGRAQVDNCYPGPVRPQGNPRAREIMCRVFEPCDSVWRGLGAIPRSGMRLRAEYRDRDAASRFQVRVPPPREPAGCRCGEVLRGVIGPAQCPLFGRACTPDNPQGACMVSSEGSCAARFNYGPRGKYSE